MFVSFLEEDIQVNILILYCVTVKWINNKYFGTYPQEKTSSHSESVSDSPAQSLLLPSSSLFERPTDNFSITFFAVSVTDILGSLTSDPLAWLLLALVSMIVRSV